MRPRIEPASPAHNKQYIFDALPREQTLPYSPFEVIIGYYEQLGQVKNNSGIPARPNICLIFFLFLE